MTASELKRIYANLALDLKAAKYIIEKSSKALPEEANYRSIDSGTMYEQKQGIASAGICSISNSM